MKHLWPIFAGAFLLFLTYVFRSHLGYDAIFYGIIVLAIMPFVETLIQGRNGIVWAILGLMLGAVCGLFAGYLLGPSLSKLFYGSISIEHNIRIDLFMWWVLFASFVASCFAAIGGWLGRRLHMKKISIT